MTGALRAAQYLRGIPGITLENLTIGSTQHPLVAALPREDEETSDNQLRQIYYQLVLPFDAAVTVGETVTIPVNDSTNFAGRLTEITPDPIRNLRWCTVRGSMEAT